MTAAPASKPSSRRRRLAPLLVLVGLNTAVFAAYTFPRTLQVRSATSRADAARSEVDAARREVTELRGRADAITANAADAERFYTSVAPPRGELLAVLEDVERMAREPGLKPGTRAYSQGEGTDPRLARVKVTLPLEGSYEQLVGFLERAEKSKHFLTVDRIALRGEEEGSASLQVELSAYFRSDGRPVAKR